MSPSKQADNGSMNMQQARRMNERQAVRFPFDALERLMVGQTDDVKAAGLGITRRSLFRLRRRGLNWQQADYYATRLGLHPGLVWPEFWEVA